MHFLILLLKDSPHDFAVSMIRNRNRYWGWRAQQSSKDNREKQQSPHVGHVSGSSQSVDGWRVHERIVWKQYFLHGHIYRNHQICHETLLKRWKLKWCMVWLVSCGDCLGVFCAECLHLRNKTVAFKIWGSKSFHSFSVWKDPTGFSLVDVWYYSSLICNLQSSWMNT